MSEQTTRSTALIPYEEPDRTLLTEADARIVRNEPVQESINAAELEYFRTFVQGISLKSDKQEEFVGSAAETKLLELLPRMESLLFQEKTFEPIFDVIYNLATSRREGVYQLGYEVLARNADRLKSYIQKPAAFSAFLPTLALVVRYSADAPYEKLFHSLAKDVRDRLMEISLASDNADDALAAQTLFYSIDKEEVADNETKTLDTKLVETLLSSLDIITQKILANNRQENRANLAKLFRLLGLGDRDTQRSLFEYVYAKCDTARAEEIARLSEIWGELYEHGDMHSAALQKLGFGRGSYGIAIGWRDVSSRTEHSLGEVVAENFRAIFELQKQAPGSPVVLFEMFGINRFNRWPIRWMHRQYERRGQTDKECWFVVKGEVDEETVVNRKDELERLFDVIGEDVDLIASDLGMPGWSFQTAHEKIKALNKGQREISKGIWITHGYEDSFSFGIHGLDVISSKEDRREKVDWDELKSCYKPHPKIFVLACKSGVVGGPVQKVSDKLDAQAMGSTLSFNFYEFADLEDMKPGDDLKVDINGGDRYVNIFDRGKLMAKG